MTGAEIEVQSAAGAVLRKVPAMSQFTVYAVDEALVVPDGVEVTAHRFSGAALAVLGGGGTSEPEGIYVCYNADKTDVLSYNLAGLTNGSSMFNKCTALTSFEADLSSLTKGDSMFYKCTSLTSFDSDLSSLTNGGGMFHLSKLNKASALRVLSSIPAYTSGTHSLTIGIHVDFKTDEEVLAAISAAESKKWTMTVQWNGTAGTSAASTYSMRGELIYARVVEENGERMLDWGHYVTDETGYETFRSIEAAREYFGIEEE